MALCPGLGSHTAKSWASASATSVAVDQEIGRGVGSLWASWRKVKRQKSTKETHTREAKKKKKGRGGWLKDGTGLLHQRRCNDLHAYAAEQNCRRRACQSSRFFGFFSLLASRGCDIAAPRHSVWLPLVASDSPLPIIQLDGAPPVPRGENGRMKRMLGRGVEKDTAAKPINALKAGRHLGSGKGKGKREYSRRWVGESVRF